MTATDQTTAPLSITFDADAARTCTSPGWTGYAESFGGYGDPTFETDTDTLLYEAWQANLIQGLQPLLWVSKDEDGAGAIITVDLPNGLRLASTYEESRHWVTDRDATGLEAAVDVVSRLVDIAHDLVARYQQQTVPAPAVRQTWPDTDEERTAFAGWQDEVSNGDTVLGFRDWLAHREADAE